jgi:ferredoxin
MLVIEPLGCVDCGLCVPECPVDAIVPENELSDSQKVFLELNAGYAAIWPNIIEAKAPLDDAEQWSGVSEKKQFLAIEEPLLD